MGIWKPVLFSVETKQPFTSLKPNAPRVKTTPAEILISTQAITILSNFFVGLPSAVIFDIDVSLTKTFA